MVKTPEKVWEDFQSAVISRSADRVNLNECEFKDLFLDINSCFPLER